MRTAPLAFIVATLYFLFCVVLCPHRNLPLQDAWLHQSRRRRSQAIDCVDLSPRDHQSRHVLKIRSKWGDQRVIRRHVDASRASDLHRMCNFEDVPLLFIRSCDLHGAPSDGRDSSYLRLIVDTSSSHLVTCGAFRSVRSPSDG